MERRALIWAIVMGLAAATAITMLAYQISRITSAPSIEVSVEYTRDTIIVKAVAMNGAYIADQDGRHVTAWSYAGSSDEAPDVYLVVGESRVPLDAVLSMGCKSLYRVGEDKVNAVPTTRDVMTVILTFTLGLFNGYLLGKR